MVWAGQGSKSARCDSAGDSHRERCCKLYCGLAEATEVGGQLLGESRFLAAIAESRFLAMIAERPSWRRAAHAFAENICLS